MERKRRNVCAKMVIYERLTLTGGIYLWTAEPRINLDECVGVGVAISILGDWYGGKTIHYKK